VLSATVQSIAAGMGSQLLLLISGPLVARLLGVEGRGYLAAVNVWGVVLTVVGTLGVPAACAYYLSQGKDDAGRILGEAYRLALWQIIVIFPLLALVLGWWGHDKPGDVRLGVYLSLAIVPANLLHQYALAILQGQHRFSALNIARVLPGLLYAVNVAGLYAADERRFPCVVGAWVVSFILAAVVSTTLALRGRAIDWQGRDCELRKELLLFGLRGHIGMLAPVDGLKLDQIAASILLSPAALGLYVVAYAFTNVPRFVAHSAGLVAYPTVARQTDAKSGYRLASRYFLAITALNVVGATALILLMPVVIPWLFGQAFAASVEISQILIVGATVVASRRILVECLRGLAHPGISTVAELSMYPWLATGGLYFIMSYGAVGLATSVSLGYGISLLVAAVAWRAVRTEL